MTTKTDTYRRVRSSAPPLGAGRFQHLESPLFLTETLTVRPAPRGGAEGREIFGSVEAEVSPKQ